MLHMSKCVSMNKYVFNRLVSSQIVYVYFKFFCDFTKVFKNCLICVLQVVQVLRAIDRDQGGQDTPIHFSIPPESSSALNLTIRETGGSTDLKCFHISYRTQKLDTSQNWCLLVVH